MRNASDSDKQLARRFKYRCIICLKRYEGIHHVVPKSLGGEDNDENKVPLCQYHHREIHNTGAVNWIKYLLELRDKRLADFEIGKR